MQELEYEYKAKELKDRMVRLLSNKDFEVLFVEDFLKDSLVQLGYNFGVQPNLRNSLAEQITARTYVKQFIDGIITDGVNAEDVIAQYENKEVGE